VPITIGKEWAMNDGKTVFAQLFVQSRMVIPVKCFFHYETNAV